MGATFEQQHLRPRTAHRLVAALFDMAPLFALLGLLGFLTSFVSATALTYKLPPNGKECFYSHIEQKGAKVAFYFAVRSSWMPRIDSI